MSHSQCVMNMLIELICGCKLVIRDYDGIFIKGLSGSFDFVLKLYMVEIMTLQ